MTDTITLPRSELQAALDALKYRWRIFPGEEGYSERNALCKTLEARLASERSEAIQQEENSFTPDWDAMAALTEEIQRMAKRIEELEREQEEKPSNADMEPVAWWHDMGDVVDLNVSGRGVPLYTAPPRQEEKQDAPKESFVSMKEKPQAWMLITEAGACGGTFRYRVDVEVAARNLGGRFAIVPLYMSPQKREWKGLTDEEQGQVAWSCGAMSADWMEFARAIEAKIKEKNT